MAFYPCSNHHAPYRGPARAAYGAIVDGTSSDRKHLRMCEPCFNEYISSVAPVLAEVDFTAEAGPVSDSTMCCGFCGDEEPECRIFINAYPKGEPERAFWGATCRKCQPQASALVLLT